MRKAAFSLIITILLVQGCAPEETPIPQETAIPIQTLPPAIEGFSPQSALAGEQVTITGTGFGQVPIGIQVFFGDVEAELVSASSTQIIAIVPENAPNDKIKVQAEGGQAFTAEAFVRNPDVYVAGYVYSNDKNVAVIWKNGVPTYLTDGQNDARARSVFVTETNVYVCGHETSAIDDSVTMAKVWRNGELLYNLSEGISAIAHSIHVFEGDVYVSGVENNFAKLWKNGSPVSLNNAESGEAFGLFVNSNAVYTSGTVGNLSTTWENSERTALPSNQDFFSIALDIAATDTDTYAVGLDFAPNPVPSVITAAVWKNGEEPKYLETTDRSVARSIFISEGDVYIVGGDYVGENEFPVLWKNDEVPTVLDVGGGAANSVHVYEGDVYIAGFTGVEARIWKNNEPVSVFQGMQQAFFESVFVK